MRRQAAWIALGLLAVALTAAAQEPARDARLVPSRRAALTIPFRIGVATNPGEQPTEVQLMVSVNRGAAWQHVGSAAPSAGKIAYTAASDGEYWFCLKTKDAAGRIRPPGPPAVELRVMVDTTPPQLKLNAWRGADGDITARWEATDANLNPQSFKLSYRAAGAGNSPWQSVAVTPPLADARGGYADTITWKSTTSVDMQAEVADAAGNVTRQVVDAAAAGSTPLPGIAPGGSPAPTNAAFANPFITGQGSSGQSAAGSSGTTPRPPAANSHPAAPAWSNRGLGSNSSQAPVNLPWQANSAKAVPWSADAVQTPAGQSRPWEAPATATPIPPVSPPPPVDPFSARTEAPRLDGVPGRRSDNPFATSAGGVLSGSLSLGGTATGAGSPGVAHGSFGTSPVRRPCLLSAREVEVSYDLGAIPPASLRSVELWGTTDGGQTWSKLATDDDNRSPVIAKVERDGMYGFRLLVHRQGGPIEFPPATGQPPEIVIEVDQTEPRCGLTRVDQLTGPRSGELVITWQASDAHLAERPITLRYSHRPDGPWRAVAVGLENNGSYTWTMPEHLPAEVYLRLEARDAADNIGHYTADRPITPQLAKPTGLLRGVAPINTGRVTDRRSEPRVYFFR